MPIKLLSPIYKTFELTRADLKYGNEGETTTVTIKQARQHEHQRRQDLFKRLERQWNTADDPNDIHLVQEVSMVEVYREEARMTMVECNIMGPDDKILFTSRSGKEGHPELAMSKQQFDEAWGQLFPDIAEEIVEKIHDVNLLWGGPQGEAV
jgi:hypothetical protein